MVEQSSSRSEASPSQPAIDDMAAIAARSQRIVSEFLSRQQGAAGMADPGKIGDAFFEMTRRMMADPGKMMRTQMTLWQDYMALWQNATRRLLGESTEPVIEPEKGDRRFKAAEWDDNFLFDYIKQSYLLTARWMQSTVGEIDGLDEKTARKVEFYTRQFADSMAPSNFVATNPEVLRETIESRGENLVRGLDNLLDDLENSSGQLRIRMTDPDAFSLGENIAVTPGAVVYQNDLIQLIQYAPATEKTRSRPLLIVPPWINKYYILDLQPKNSFIKWAVERGYTVFVISWANPETALAAKTFEDYMLEGPLAALDAIERATGEAEATAIGYCLGGTLLACTLGYMAATGDDRIKAATYLASMIDFSEPGDLGVFVDEDQLEALEQRMSEKGYLEGSAMANTFNMLRANDLIWAFVVNNYLLGKEPFPFDLLYWNSDTTRMPAAMHSFYLRKMYIENKLIEPGGMTLAGQPIDLGRIETPTYILSTREDHISPWKSTYAASQLYGGPVRFVLAASGHIAGVINPPQADKYSHWKNAKNPPTPEAWLDGAKQEAGSWWHDWDKWNARKSGKKIPARNPGDGKLKPIEAAPGSYVRTPAED